MCLRLVALRKESVDRNAAKMKVGGIDVSVALRKESVDRNIRKMIKLFTDEGSLSARRAWIEIHLSVIL